MYVGRFAFRIALGKKNNNTLFIDTNRCRDCQSKRHCQFLLTEKEIMNMMIII